MHKRTLLPLVLLLGSGCDPTMLLWPPVKEGLYLVELVALVDDTCGYTEEDVGIGRSEELELIWHNETLVMTDGESAGEYLWTGETFEALGYGENQIDDTCTLIVESLLVGEALDRERFGLIDNMRVSVTGDCSAWDTSALPCDAQLAWEGNLIE
ncbi:MAG: hypothetical protein H6740_19240 [Alphaproteobacteria bacterium]|nr:hypothetical protein [Alphaproteobacteria bacterium]